MTSLKLAVMLAALHATAAQAEDFVIIRNAASGREPISKVDLRGALTGKVRAWAGGAVVVVVLPSDASPAFAWLADRVFSVSPKLLSSKIKQEVFKGDMNKPVTAVSDVDVLERVKESAGALGIISAAAAQTLPANVVLLSVDGL